MGISKLTCTLKGDVPPKWSLDEDVSISIDMCWRMCAKFPIILSIYHAIACSRNKLIEYFSPLFLFSYSIEGFWECESYFPQETQDRDPISYTRTSSGTCVEKMIKSIFLWYHWSRLFSEWNERGLIIMNYSWKFTETMKYKNTLFLLMKQL